MVSLRRVTEVYEPELADAAAHQGQGNLAMRTLIHVASQLT